MSRTLVNAAACALACLALLAACDKTKTPAPTTSSAPAGAVSKPPSGPAAAPAQPAAAIKQVRVLHVTKEGEESLDSLKPLEGKYRWDGVDYLQQGVLAGRLKALVGVQYDTLLKNLQTLGPLEPAAGLLYVMGNRQHQGGEEMAAVVIDPVRNGLRVWLLSEGKQTVFTDVDGAEIPWPSDVETMFRNIVATH
ncbi:hypothetical protein [Comamonas guangdongensis]|uniref:Lipoprotein n=1 Tax=Comamonas guangdongensis TaxID=510515 RepID=A0ABV3ZUA6_9BURK